MQISKYNVPRVLLLFLLGLAVVLPLLMTASHVGAV